MQGGTTYTFVTDGIEAALEFARAAGPPVVMLRSMNTVGLMAVMLTWLTGNRLTLLRGMRP